MELRTRLRLLAAHERVQLARSIGADSGNVEDLIHWSKTLALDDRQELEARARAWTTQFEPSAQQLDRFAPMTWEQARGLDARLISIGSHTISHPILTALPGSEQQHEISGSRQLIEQRLGRSADLFCYPNGAASTATVELVRMNYRAAVTTRPAFVERDDARHLLPRIHAGPFAGLFLRRLHRPGA